MKQIVKVVLTSTLAVGLLAGGGFALQHNQAFADETGAASPTSTPSVHKQASKDHKGFGGHAKGGFDKKQFHGNFPGAGGKGFVDPASVLGIDASVLKEEIKQGKTLAQIAQEKAGLTEEALLQKLTEAETKRIDEALGSGKIKQEQADKMKAGLADRLKKMVESTPKAMEFHGKPQGRPGGMMPGAWGNSDKIAGLLGITKDELDAQRKAGKSLAEIAAEKGITEDQLIQRLKDSMTDELKQFVEHKGAEPKGPKPAPRRGDRVPNPKPSETAPAATDAPSA